APQAREDGPEPARLTIRSHRERRAVVCQNASFPIWELEKIPKHRLLRAGMAEFFRSARSPFGDRLRSSRGREPPVGESFVAAARANRRHDRTFRAQTLRSPDGDRARGACERNLAARSTEHAPCGGDP